MSNRPDPFDVPALEKSLNDSAVRVSTIWVSYLIFGLYLVIAAGNVTHRQLFLSEPIKLPVLNVDLPLVGFFFLAPILFVILHMYVLLQLTLLSHTASAYNEAVERTERNEGYRDRIRQRLTNTLFAQLLAGSRKEREGALGWLLNVIAFVALVVGPLAVLLFFEIRFLPYHSSFISWVHRSLIMIDVVMVALLWSAARISLRSLTFGVLLRRSIFFAFLLVTLVVGILPSFPGEKHSRLIRYQGTASGQPSSYLSNVCNLASPLADLLGPNFDRLSLQGDDFVDDDLLSKLTEVGKQRGLAPYAGPRTITLNDRDLSCADLRATDLRRASFERTTLVGARLDSAQLQGSDFDRSNIQAADLSNARGEGASFMAADLRMARLSGTNLRGARLEEAKLQLAVLNGSLLQESTLHYANLDGASLERAILRGVFFLRVSLQGASMRSAGLQSAMFKESNARGAVFDDAGLQTVTMDGIDLEGASFVGARLQGASISGSVKLADFSRAFLWRAILPDCSEALTSGANFDAVIGTVGLTQLHPTKEGIDQLIEGIARFRESEIPENVQRMLHDKLDEAHPVSRQPPCQSEQQNIDDYQDKLAAALLKEICESKNDSIPIAMGVSRRLGGNVIQKPLTEAVRRQLNDRVWECPAAAILAKASATALASTDSLGNR